MDKLNPWALSTIMALSLPQKDPAPRQANESTLTNAEQKKRAKKRKMQKQARKRNR
ncbi:MAG: hypothetical protein PQ612_06125 [Rickettsiales bacterium]|nr:hypothetical protein [Pseudomonadota bacterium]MDA0966548.1 hypothetical protein [Pseudomonadota bacterium]MDG4543577.1 hypothetical protein [Rickettsiales bacterium]MDG4545724.1 hypothetical protein [Rickettsiales bacterium]MDG4547503.1 hypothetical protein [Rickettsiales bacterium]